MAIRHPSARRGETGLIGALLVLDWAVEEPAQNLVLRLVASPAGLRAIEFHPSAASPGEDLEDGCSCPLLIETARQLRAYFAGELREFRLPLDLQGSPFQLSVWRALRAIPYGQTRSYSDIARAVGSPQAMRAVGAANGSNPVPIVVPCHRVIGAGGSLVGYGGGLPLKKRLLELERGPGLFAAGEGAWR